MTLPMLTALRERILLRVPITMKSALQQRLDSLSGFESRRCAAQGCRRAFAPGHCLAQIVLGI